MRTSVDKVASIIKVDTYEVTDLEPFILTANELVTELCVPLGYSATRLEVIERWLAAHFYAIRDPLGQSEGAGGVSMSYQGQTAMYLESTTYGQQAMLMDTKGGLARLNATIKEGRKVTKALWLGTKL